MRRGFAIVVKGSQEIFYVLLLSLFLRLFFAWVTRTTFVPDEYFQTIEPAFALAEKSQHAIITWEWRDPHRLRSFASLLPYLMYYSIDALVRDCLNKMLWMCSKREGLLVTLSCHIVPILAWLHSPLVGPRTAQALLSSIGDIAVYDVARQLFPARPGIARGSVLMHLFGWSGLYMHSRTLSNCSEASLVAVIAAFLLRACHCFDHATIDPVSNGRTGDARFTAHIYTLVTVTFSVVAVFIRPTALALLVPMWVYALCSIPRRFAIDFLLIALGTGIVITSMCLGFDYQMYLVLNDKLLSAEGSESRGIDCDATTIQGWMDCINAFMSYFAPYNFFKWNILRNFSSKFGVNAWHWNFTQGFPVMLGGHLIFVCFAVYKLLVIKSSGICGKMWSTAEDKTLSSTNHAQSDDFPEQFGRISWNGYTTALRLLVLALIYSTALSLSPHKEFRFLLPCLPAVYIASSALLYAELCDETPKSTSVRPASEDVLQRSCGKNQIYKRLSWLVCCCVGVCHLCTAFYLCRYHQRVFNVLDAVDQSGGERLMHELVVFARKYHLSRSNAIAGCDDGIGDSISCGSRSPKLVVDLMIPCHATPGYFSVFYPSPVYSMRQGETSGATDLFVFRFPDCSPDLAEGEMTETDLLRRDGVSQFISCIAGHGTLAIEDTGNERPTCIGYDRKTPWHSDRYKLSRSQHCTPAYCSTGTSNSSTDSAFTVVEPFPGDILVLFDSDLIASTHSLLVDRGFVEYISIAHAHFQYDADDPAPKKKLHVYVKNTIIDSL